MADFVEITLEETPRYNGVPNSAPFRLAQEKLYMPVTAAKLRPNRVDVDRGDELRNITGDIPNLVESYDPDGTIAEHAYTKDLLWLLALNGWTWTTTVGVGGGTNAVQTITTTGVPTGGTFRLAFKGVFTAPIVYNASAAVIQAALLTLPGMPAGTVVCTVGPLPTGVVCTFGGLLGAQVVPLITFDDSGLTGGATPHVVVTNTTPGVPGTVTDPDGVTIPATVQKWVFTKRNAITAQTAQVKLNYTTENIQLLGQGYGVDKIALDAAGSLTADLMGMVLTRQAYDSGTTPSLLSQVVPPLRRGDLFLTWLAGGGKVEDFSLDSACGLERVRSLGLDPPSLYPDSIEYGDNQVEVTGKIPKRALSSTDIDALLNATTFSSRARWKTPKVILATTYPYAVFCEMPSCMYVAGEPGDLKNSRRMGATFDFKAFYDETAGYDVRWTIFTDVSSIATYV